MSTPPKAPDPPVNPFDDTVADVRPPPTFTRPSILYFSKLDYLEFLLHEGRQLATGTEFVDERVSLVRHPHQETCIGFQLLKFKELARSFEEGRNPMQKGFSPSVIDLIDRACAYLGKNPNRDEPYVSLKKMAAPYLVPLEVWHDVVPPSKD